MESSSTETASLNSTETSLIVGEEYSRMHEYLLRNVSQYVTSKPKSTNTRLFGFLAMLNKYIPESYLSMSECQKILGPPDSIHGGPPFEQRMEPFTQFIRKSTDDDHIYIYQEFAETALEVMANSGFTRSTIVKDLMSSLCGDEPQPDTVEFVKDLLTKREMGEKGKEKFSRLILDICEREIFHHAISVLKTASNIMRRHHVFPQTLSRFFYIRRNIRRHSYEKAEKWAQEAIRRAPNNSFVADTLGQVYKNRLLWNNIHPQDVLKMADKAWLAFKDVERKADREEGQEMMNEAGALYITSTFNNRGKFGLIQVAKIAKKKLRKVNDPQQRNERFLRFRTEVEIKFDFFEWYLTYSQIDKTSLEPPCFWKDIAVCYRLYTGELAADSTSFPGLLEHLNRGLFTSRGRYSGFLEVEETQPELEMICNELRNTYEADVDDDTAAERYILSNIILSNRAPNSPSLTPLTELQGILSRFLDNEARNRSPEFYLLVLLLFWLQEDPQVVQERNKEEVEQPKTEDNTSKDQTSKDGDRNKEQETEGESAQPSQEVEFESHLQQYVTDIGRAFEAWYSKYLRGRYLVPLFFLGKGFGLSKWIHKSKLDGLVETEVDARRGHENNGTQSPNERNRQKWKKINELWSTGEVWQIPNIQEILLPVTIDQPHPPTNPQENKVFVLAEGRRILATKEFESDAQEQTPFYLGFTIQGPVVYKGHMQTCLESDG